MNKMYKSILSVIACLFTGCVVPWTYTTESMITNPYHSLSLKTPVNWYTRHSNKYTVFTRNGLSLESITISRLKWDDTLSNGYSIPSNVLLHEIPEIILGEYCARDYAFNLTIDENQIVIIDSLPVSRTSYRYTSPNSLTMSGIMYCIPFVNQIAVLSYEAETSNYYAKSIDGFISMINSMEINSRKYLSLPGIRPVKKVR